MKQRTAGLVLLISLVAPLGLSLALLQYQKRLIRKEVKWRLIEGIAREDLVLLRFTEREKQQLEWKHAREFEYKGQMYDIVEVQMNGDTTYYWCWWDNEETFLNQKLQELVANALKSNPKRAKSQNELLSFLKLLYFDDSGIQVLKPNELFKEEMMRHRSMFVSLFALSPPSPPPKIA